MKSACPQTMRAPVFAHGVPRTHTRPGLYPRSCLQACNPKPGLLDGSHGRTALVPLVFCGHQGVLLHLPSMFLSLFIPGGHCNYKNLVNTVSVKHGASWPMQFHTLFFKKKREMFPASLNVHGSIGDPSLIPGFVCCRR